MDNKEDANAIAMNPYLQHIKNIQAALLDTQLLTGYKLFMKAKTPEERKYAMQWCGMSESQMNELERATERKKKNEKNRKKKKNKKKKKGDKIDTSL